MADLNVRILLELIDKTSGPARRIRGGLEDVGKAGARAAKSFDLSARLHQASMGVERLANQAKQLLIKPVMEYVEFEKAVAEVSTLIDESVISQEKLAQISEEAAMLFGGKAVDQAKALYQAISAGAGNATDATALLDAANRLAIGGVTDVTTAVDGLTTAINAYGLDMTDAEQVSDSFFVAVRAGKTTIAELSSSIGKVAPIAAAMGLSLDETNAAIATLTKQGINTRFAVSGLKAAFSNILKPTGEASDLAEDLGIQFNTTALKAKGLHGFLSEITATSGLTSDQLAALHKQAGGNAEVFEVLVEKAGGNIKAMSTLFGSVEGVNAMLALTADNGRIFADVLAQEADQAGSTEAALAKMEATNAHALERTRAELDKTIRTLGKGFMPAVTDVLGEVVWLTKAIGAFAKAHPDAVRAVGSLLIKLVAFGFVLRTTMLLVGTISGAKGMMGMVDSMARAATGADTLRGALHTRLNPAMGSSLKTLAGSAGLVALAGGLGYALGMAADKAFGLSDAIAGINREGERLRGNVAHMEDLEEAERKALKAAQERLEAAKAAQATGLGGGWVGAVAAGLTGGSFGVALAAGQAVDDEVENAAAEIEQINTRALARRRAREAEDTAALAIPLEGPVDFRAVAAEKKEAERRERIQAGTLQGQIQIETRVQDDRVVQVVQTGGDLGDTQTIATGMAGVGL